MAHSVQTADSWATVKKLNGKSVSLRRARLQPCRKYLDQETALAAEVRFFISFPRSRSFFRSQSSHERSNGLPVEIVEQNAHHRQAAI
jgi:hypothetical protein